MPEKVPGPGKGAGAEMFALKSNITAPALFPKYNGPGTFSSFSSFPRAVQMNQEI